MYTGNVQTYSSALVMENIRLSPRTPTRDRGAPQTLRLGRAAACSQYISSPPPPADFFSSFGMSATRASLVSSSVATLAAFCRA